MAMDVAGVSPARSAPCWRSPYSNPELEYLYLGSPQTSQCSPLMQQPSPIITNILQQTGNAYGDHQQLGYATPVYTQPGFVTAPGISIQPPNQSIFTPKPPQVIYTDAQFNDNIWSSLDSDVLDVQGPQYKISPEDISMVEAYAPPGYGHSRASHHTGYANAWAAANEHVHAHAQAIAGETHSSTHAGSTTHCAQPAMVQQRGFAAPQYPRVAIESPLDMMMQGPDTVSESVSSTDAQLSYASGFSNGNFRDSSSQPDSSIFVEPSHAAMQSDAFSALAPIRHLGEPRWAEQLLNLCAAAIASQNISRTQHLMWVLNDLASVSGDANQRFAAYGLRALFCRITGRMEAAATFMRPRHHDQEVSLGPKTVHRALVKFHEYVPWHQNCYSVTSHTLLEVCAGKSRLHLIDIGVGKGIEWPIFIDALVSRPGGPPSILRMTMIRDLRREELNISTAKSVNSEAADFMGRLVKFASLLGLRVEVNMVQKPLECITREDLKIRDGEILAVVCQFRLHRLSEEPPPRVSPAALPRLSPRDEFLEFIYSLEPHVFIQSDNDSDHCSHDFLTRFQNCMSFWWLCYESMGVGYAGRDPEERQILEYEGSMMMLNAVACEGVARIERNEAYDRWQRRITRAGFVPREVSEGAMKASQNLVANHNELWTVELVGTNCVSLQWRKQPTTFTSVWRAATFCPNLNCKCPLLHR